MCVLYYMKPYSAFLIFTSKRSVFGERMASSNDLPTGANTFLKVFADGYMYICIPRGYTKASTLINVCFPAASVAKIDGHKYNELARNPTGSQRRVPRQLHCKQGTE